MPSARSLKRTDWRGGRDFADGRYSMKVGEKGAIAQGWIFEKMLEQANKASAQTIEMQSRAIKAAERQAAAAEDATTLARWAIGFSVAAIVISIAAIILEMSGKAAESWPPFIARV